MEMFLQVYLMYISFRNVLREFLLLPHLDCEASYLVRLFTREHEENVGCPCPNLTCSWINFSS